MDPTSRLGPLGGPTVLIEFPDGTSRRYVLLEHPEIGKKLVGVGLEAGWITTAIAGADYAKSEHSYVVSVKPAE